MDIFDLSAKITLDSSGYDEGVDKARGKMKKLAGGLKGAIGGFTKISIAAIGAATAATSAVAGMSVKSYAQYEQLAGGVETLFKESAGIVSLYAKNAYKNAGMSANEYMSTVTSFSATLLQSLEGNTKAAAYMSNVAVQDMADNANKMGTSMEMIQNAYQGFAKANYTMLDNLKLGYGGTAREMARLVNESGVLGKVKIDLDDTKNLGKALNEVGFDKIIQAIHKVQEEMGITGTTAAEAEHTIEGSVNSMKAAWENLMVGISDENQDVSELIQEFADSAVAAAENVGPRIEQALEGIGEVITISIPKIMDALPGAIERLLPKMLKSGAGLLSAIVQGILQSLPKLIQTAVDLIVKLAVSLGDNMDKILVVGGQIIETLLFALLQALPDLIIAAGHLIAKFVEGMVAHLPDVVGFAFRLINEFIKAITDGLVMVLAAGVDIIMSLWEGMKKAWNDVVEWFNGVWDSLFGHRTANITVNKTETVTKNYQNPRKPGKINRGTMAGGIDYVPFDEFRAVLHKGERVLTREESENYRGNNRAPVSIVQNIYSEAKTAADLMEEALYQQKREVLLGV